MIFMKGLYTIKFNKLYVIKVGDRCSISEIFFTLFASYQDYSFAFGMSMKKEEQKKQQQQKYNDAAMHHAEVCTLTLFSCYY